MTHTITTTTTRTTRTQTAPPPPPRRGEGDAGSASAAKCLVLPCSSSSSFPPPPLIGCSPHRPHPLSRSGPTHPPHTNTHTHTHSAPPPSHESGSGVGARARRWGLGQWRDHGQRAAAVGGRGEAQDMLGAAGRGTYTYEGCALLATHPPTHLSTSNPRKCAGGPRR